jgi:thioredoxin-related protein
MIFMKKPFCQLPLFFLILLSLITIDCKTHKIDVFENNANLTARVLNLKITEHVFNKNKSNYDTIITFVYMNITESYFSNEFHLKIVQPDYPRYMEIRGKHYLKSNAHTNFSMDTSLLPEDSMAYSEKLKQIAPMLFYYGPYANFTKKLRNPNTINTSYDKCYISKLPDSLNTVIWNYKKRKHLIKIEQYDTLLDYIFWGGILASYHKTQNDERFRVDSIHSNIELRNFFKQTTLLVFFTQGCSQEPIYYKEIASLKKYFKHHFLDVKVLSHDADYNLKTLNKKYRKQILFETDVLKLDRLFGIKQSPTFLLFDKDGNILLRMHEQDYSLERIKEALIKVNEVH